jgi:hypothetical protein
MVSSKFNPAEWHSSNETHYMNAFREVENGKSLRNASDKLAKTIAYDASKMQKHVREKIGHRIKDVASWKAEVEKERSCVISEMQALLQCKAMLEKALVATQHPLTVPKKCLAYRTNRAGIDLVKDTVEKQLFKVNYTVIEKFIHCLYCKYLNDFCLDIYSLICHSKL